MEEGRQIRPGSSLRSYAKVVRGRIMDNASPKKPCLSPFGGKGCYVYLLRCKRTRYYRIGAAADPWKCRDDIQVASPHNIKLETIALVPSIEIADKAEKEIRRRLTNYQCKRGWYRFNQAEIRPVKEYLRRLQTCSI